MLVPLISCLLTLPTHAWSTPRTQAQITLHAQDALDQQHAVNTHSNSKSRTNNGSTISNALFTELEELARVVDITYCVGAYGSGIQEPFTCPSRCVDFPSFELIKAFNTGPLLSDSCGFLALSHAPAPPRIILAFRGTYSITNTIADLSTVPQEYAPYPGADDGSSGGGDDDGHEPEAPRCVNCTVHTGFYTSWANTREAILPLILKAREEYPEYNVTVVGHSLGGAVAAFAGLELVARGFHPTVTTFGEPRIGNAAMARYLDDRFDLSGNHTSPDHHAYRRVTHVGDPVPLLPLNEWGYVPHGGEIFISKWDLTPENEDVRHCTGASDPACLEGPTSGFWVVPARFKLWQLFFAHRDYFWRLGLCLPPLDGWWPGLGKEVEL